MASLGPFVKPNKVTGPVLFVGFAAYLLVNKIRLRGKRIREEEEKQKSDAAKNSRNENS